MRIWTCFFKVPLSENCAPQVYRVSHQCGYGHVSLNYILLRIVTTGITFFSPVWLRTCVFKLHLNENCESQVSHFSPQCGYGHVSSNYILMRIVNHRYHICSVSPQCGYGHVSSNYILLRIVITGITFFSPVWLWTCVFQLHLNENCESQVSHL